MTITARVHNGVIELPPGTQLPEGAELRIIVPEAPAADPVPSPLAWMTEFAGAIKTLPPDFAERHDHYIHGRKRQIE